MDRLLSGLQEVMDEQADALSNTIDRKFKAIERANDAVLSQIQSAAGTSEPVRKKTQVIRDAEMEDTDARPAARKPFGSSLQPLGAPGAAVLKTPGPRSPFNAIRSGAKPVASARRSAVGLRAAVKKGSGSASSNGSTRASRHHPASLSEQLLSIRESEDELDDGDDSTVEYDDDGNPVENVVDQALAGTGGRRLVFDRPLRPTASTISLSQPMPATATAPLRPTLAEAAEPRPQPGTPNADEQLRNARIQAFLRTLPDKELHFFTTIPRVSDTKKPPLNVLDIPEGIPMDWLGTHPPAGPPDTFTFVDGDTMEAWAQTIPEQEVYGAGDKLEPIVTFWHGSKNPASRIDYMQRTFGIKWNQRYRRMPMIICFAITLNYHEVHARDKIRSQQENLPPQ